MLLQLEEAHADDVNKLLAFAKSNNLKLSLVDENESNLLLPGKPLTEEQLLELINHSRNSKMISMTNAHEIIGSYYNAD